MNVAILASGKGSNVENILSYFTNDNEVNIVLIGSNNNNSGALNHAKNYNVLTLLFSKKELESSDILLKSIIDNNVDLLVLAGFLLKIPTNFIQSFHGKIINIHPSLLPKYGGKGMYGDNVHLEVLKNKEKQSGVTFHYVNENYDEGKIIAQFPITLQKGETLSSLKQKINQLEWANYPKIIDSLNDA